MELWEDKLKSAKALLFDFDGTLMNLDELNVSSFAKFFEDRYNLKFTRDDFMKYISGKGSIDGIMAYLAEHEIMEFDAQQLTPEFHRVKDNKLMTDVGEYVSPIPGVIDFLKKASGKYYMHIATSSRKRYVEAALKYYGVYDIFTKDGDRVLDRDDITKSKPDPQIFQMAIDASGYSVDECVAFEDSRFGLQSAKNAGLYTFGVLNKGWNDEFVYDIADHVIDSYSELIVCLK